MDIQIMNTRWYRSPDRESGSAGGDLRDSRRDAQRLAPEETILDLPDVKDIPGQEHVHVPSLGELADTTISSDDEEGAGIFDDEEDEDAENEDDDINAETGSTDEDSGDLTDDDLAGLESTEDNGDPSDDDQGLRKAALDDEDFEGDALNETDDVSGVDLDVPGSEEDDEDEASGEEDEENNSYSLDDDDEDDA